MSAHDPNRRQTQFQKANVMYFLMNMHINVENCSGRYYASASND
jgi:hypothetical protein